MSEMTIHTILCDFSEDCEVEPPYQSSSLTAVRERAASAGWVTDQGWTYDGRPEVLDFCPDHSSPEAREESRALKAALEKAIDDDWLARLAEMED